MTEEKLEKFKKFEGSWEFEMQADNIEEVLAAQGKYILDNKVGCVLPMVVSLLPCVGFRPTGHREDAPHFILYVIIYRNELGNKEDSQKTYTENNYLLCKLAK